MVGFVGVVFLIDHERVRITAILFFERNKKESEKKRENTNQIEAKRNEPISHDAKLS